MTAGGLDPAGAQILAALDAARALPTYEGIAALLIGTVFAIIGGLLLRNGLGKLDVDAMTPDRDPAPVGPRRRNGPRPRLTLLETFQRKDIP